MSHRDDSGHKSDAAPEAAQTFFELSRDMLAIANNDGRLEILNPAWQETLGWTPEELSASPFIDFVHPDDVEATTREAQRIAKTGRIRVGFTNRYRCKDGSYRWLEWNTRAGPDGRLYCVARDITERRRRDDWLRYLESAVESTHCGLLITDASHPENPITYVNPGFERITGYREEEVLGKSCRLLQAGDRDQEGLHKLREAIRGQKSCQVLLRNYRKDGTLFMNQITVAPVKSENGGQHAFVGVIVDVTQRLRVEEDLQLLMDRMPTSVIYIDQDNRIRYANEAYARLLGLTKEFLTGRSPGDFLSAEAWSRVRGWLRKAMQGFEHVKEVRPELGSRPGAVFRVRHVPERDPAGKVTGCLVLIDDITQYKRTQERLDRQASSDALTGLSNRRGFHRELEDCFNEARVGAERHTVCLVDLDTFKPVNDSAGHEAGDRMLKLVAQAMRRVVRRQDLVGRLGGDEFAVLLKSCDLNQAERIGENLVKAIESVKLRHGGRSFSVGASAGLAEAAGRVSAEAWLKAADEACYDAKRAGGKRCNVSRDYHPTISRVQWASTSESLPWGAVDSRDSMKES